MNRILIALMSEEGDIFTPEFFETLRKTTDEVFFIPGIDRSRVTSLFTPNVRFTEVVEDGISGGNTVGPRLSALYTKLFEYDGTLKKEVM